MHQLDELLDRLVSAIANRELSASLACFTDEAAVLGSEQGEEAVGKDDLHSFFERAYAKPGAYRFRFDERTWVLREDIAWMISNGSVTEPGKEDAKPYRLAAVFERRDSEWRMALWCGTEPV